LAAWALTEGDESLFALCIRVRSGESERIFQDQRGVGEIDPMLLEVAAGLFRIPPIRHRQKYA